VKPVYSKPLWNQLLCSVYTGYINKDFLYWDFILKFGLYKILVYSGFSLYVHMFLQDIIQYLFCMRLQNKQKCKVYYKFTTYYIDAHNEISKWNKNQYFTKSNKNQYFTKSNKNQYFTKWNNNQYFTKWNINQYFTKSNNTHYHIFCCNMFIFACPIIAKSQCWLFALRANIRICPRIQLPVSAQWSQRLYVLLVQRKMMHKDICIKSYFNQINTFQHIEIKFK